ncbi:glycosyltransferase family A protein [uncultured Odoribacter sp.]|uniref:glycosyltransferase family 2 protein n=1 Tax=uncultured Odoribacter sp. TaxID=876416 RepID=UPI00262694AA|nr:glycosyltransferase family A protein [uncultured Odoribacter sp.]
MSQSGDYPLFTVIIPTKNRAEYIRDVLRTCMIQEYPNFEIIVSDDGSVDNSVEIVRELAKRDNRIKLFAHEKCLGMRDNFEFALNQVRPGYVMALGGDDGLVVDGIQRMYEILRETNKELLTWTTSFYQYPTSEDPSGKFILRKGRGIVIYKSGEYLNKISHTLWYISEDCPMFYIKGVVSTRLVEKVKSRTIDHCFYSCPTPDGFSGVVLAGEVDEYVFSREPLSIGGSSPKSQGKAYLRTDPESRKESELFFRQNADRPMHRELASQPYSPLIALMTADYLLTARDLPGWPGKYTPIDFENLIRKCFDEVANRYFEKELLIRELKIVRKIAEQHNLIKLFDRLMQTTKKKIRHRKKIFGSVITRDSIIFDASAAGINSLYDAAFATKYLYNIYSHMPLSRVFNNIIKTILKNRKYSYEALPDINDVSSTKF